MFALLLLGAPMYVVSFYEDLKVLNFIIMYKFLNKQRVLKISGFRLMSTFVRMTGSMVCRDASGGGGSGILVIGSSDVALVNHP